MSIIIKDLYHTYQSGSPNETHALKNINLEIGKGTLLALSGILVQENPPLFSI